MKKILLSCLLFGSLLNLNQIKAQSISVDFTGMTPHIGQKLELRLVDKQTKTEIERTMVSSISMAAFSVTLNNAIQGKDYWIEMYADLNGNGTYDMVPTDHAWRIDADNISAGVNPIAFSHNTNFDEINWKHQLTFDLSSMTPHIGQQFEVRLLDINRNMKEVYRKTIASISSASFSMTFPALEIGHSYFLEYYADLNGNGTYDMAPTDHSWKTRIDNVTGDMNVAFSHNTNFVNLDWTYLMSLQMSGLTPHLGQLIELRVVNSVTGEEIGRTSRTIDVVDVTLEVPGIKMGESYNLDFYADLNGNMIYDVIPTDHAWREPANSITGNTIVPFTHNLNFVDIAWDYLLTFKASGMTPHLGQMFELRVVNTNTSIEVGRVKVDTITTVDFELNVPGIEIGENYNVDYYADLSNNNSYDAPPTDHAWRDNFMDISGDTTIDFSHNVNFVDIMWPASVGINEYSLVNEIVTYPNPFYNQINIDSSFEIESIVLRNTQGQEIQLTDVVINDTFIQLNGLSNLTEGMYFVQLIGKDKQTFIRVIKK